MKTIPCIFIAVFTFLVFTCISNVNAQDTIVKKNGKPVVGFIKEVDKKYVRYLRPDLTDGPLFTIEKVDIMKIIYANGVVDTLSHASALRKPPPGQSFGFGQNNPTGRDEVFLIPTDVFFSLVSGGYEHYFKKGKLSVAIPISIGLKNAGIIEKEFNEVFERNYSDLSDYYNPYKTFSTALDLKFYPRGQHEVTFYFGPSLGIGQIKYSFYNVYYNYEYVDYDTFFSLMAHTGLQYQPYDHFKFTLFLKGGIDIFKLETAGPFLNPFSGTDVREGLQFGISAAYRFQGSPK